MERVDCARGVPMRQPSADDLQAVVNRAKKRGARAAEALYERETGLGLLQHPGQPPTRTPRVVERLRVRVWTGLGEGTGVGALSDVDRVIDAALASLQPAPPEAGPVVQLRPMTSGLATEDRRLGNLALSDRLEVLEEAAAGARLADERYRLDEIGYEERLVQRMFASSAGTRVSERSTTFRAWAAGTAAPAATPIPLRSAVSARSFASVASLPFGIDLARRAAALLEPPVLLPRGPVRVLLRSPQTAELLLRLASFCVPGVIDATFLPHVVLDPKLHVVDDPTMPGGLKSRGFDDRGVPPIPLTLIREGCAHATLLDAASALARDVRPSGHEVGDHLEPSNLVLRHGTRSVHVILGELGGTTFAPDELAGFEGLDPATGQFAATVHGTVYEGALPVGPALSVRLSGYLGHVLANIVEISGETDRVGAVDAPAIVLDGFSVG
jgi:PmbA protein